MTNVVNVLVSLSAAGSFSEAMLPKRGELVVTDDDLSCGPATPLRSIDEWSAMRQAYWDSIVSDAPSRSFARALTENAAALRTAESIVLWVGVGAAEQLHLAWLMQFRKLIGCDAPMSIVQYTQLPDRTGAWTLGLLKPERFSQHPLHEQLSADDIAELERYWTTVASPDPTQLLTFVAETSARFPQFRPSVRPLLQRYPDSHSGLGRWDLALLKCTQEAGPKVARVIGNVLGQGLDADVVGDAYLMSRLRRLAAAALAHPLITLAVDGKHMWSDEVALTPDGEAVLAGRTNAVELNGIDDWVLGVHLDSKAGSVWYHEDGTLIKG